MTENYFSNKEENKKPDLEDVYSLPKVLELKRPIVFGKRTITELVFSTEPTMSSLDHMPASEAQIKLGHLKPIIAEMTNQSQSLIDKMSLPDFRRCMEIVNPFISDVEEEEDSTD
jgi:hypothetical protein